MAGPSEPAFDGVLRPRALAWSKAPAVPRTPLASGEAEAARRSTAPSLAFRALPATGRTAPSAEARALGRTPCSSKPFRSMTRLHGLRIARIPQPGPHVMRDEPSPGLKPPLYLDCLWRRLRRLRRCWR